MAEFYKDLSDENLEIIRKVIASGTNPNLKWLVIGDNKSKECVKVAIQGELQRNAFDYDYVVILNEIIFDNLSSEYKIIATERALAYIEYDLDKDKIKKNQPDFQEHTRILEKYGSDTILALKAALQQATGDLSEI